MHVRHLKHLPVCTLLSLFPFDLTVRSLCDRFRVLVHFFFFFFFSFFFTVRPLSSKLISVIKQPFKREMHVGWARDSTHVFVIRLQFSYANICLNSFAYRLIFLYSLIESNVSTQIDDITWRWSISKNIERY